MQRTKQEKSSLPAEILMQAGQNEAPASPGTSSRFVGPTHGALNNVCDPTDNAAFYQEPIPQLFLELAHARGGTRDRSRKLNRTALVSVGWCEKGGLIFSIAVNFSGPLLFGRQKRTKPGARHKT